MTPNRPGWFLAVILLIASGLLTPLCAQEYRNLSSVHDGSGTMAAGGTFTNWSAAGQPGGIAVSSNGDLVNYAGFLQAVDIKHPTQDTDGDGVIDEISQDNDGDGLFDAQEVEGDTFDPVTPTEVNIADTDGDGISDGREREAETDPTDETMNLRILSVTKVGDTREITYFAKADKTYIIRGAQDSFREPDANLGSDVEPNGAGPWLVRTNLYVDALGGTDAYFYAVQPSP